MQRYLDAGRSAAARRRRTTITGQILLLVFFAFRSAVSAPLDNPRKDAFFSNPALRELMEWVTFRLDFDGRSMVPDMAAGDSAFRLQGTPIFADGLKGSSLMAGEGGSASYRLPLNFPLSGRGAMTMWICPVAWTHQNGGTTVFAMTANSTFYLERQGPGHNVRGELTQDEIVLFLVRTPASGSACLTFGTRDWKPGVWRFIAATWSWPIISFSLDGGPFTSKTLKATPKANEFGDMTIGAQGGEKTLIDEIMVFRRPLSDAEVKLLYENTRPIQAEP